MSNNTVFLEEMMQEIGQVETLKQGLALFETVAMPARNFSAQTRKSYHGDLTDLLAFLEKRDVTKLAQVGLQDLESYQAEMDRREYRPSTRRRKTCAIKSWFKFLHHQGVFADDVAQRLIPPRPERQEPRFLSEAEYQQLLRVCSHHPRDAAIIEVLLQTGMLLSELAKLTLSDIEIPKRITRDHDNTGSVRVRRKGGKTQVIPLTTKPAKPWTPGSKSGQKWTTWPYG